MVVAPAVFEPPGRMVASSVIKVEVLPLRDVPDIAELWRDLESRGAGSTSFFTSWGWIGTLLNLLPAHLLPKVALARRAGKVLGLALLVPNTQQRHGIIRSAGLFLNHTGEASVDCLAAEYNGVLLDKEAPSSCLADMLQEIAGCSEWDELFLGCVHETNPLLTTTPWEASGLRLNVQRLDACYFVDLEALRRGGKTYLASLGPSTRSRIKRSIRDYEQRVGIPITVRAAANRDEALKFFEALKHFHQRYWTSRGEPGSFANELFDKFHRRLVTERFAGGEIQLLKISAGDHVIGYLYNFIYGDSVLCYQSGFDYSDPKLTPGLVSHFKSVEFNLKSSLKKYNFLAGESKYKTSLSSGSDAMYWATLQRDRALFRLENFLRGTKRRILFQRTMHALPPVRPSTPKPLMIIDTATLGGPGKGVLQFLRHTGIAEFDYSLATFVYRNPRSTEFIDRASLQGTPALLLRESFRFDPSLIYKAWRLLRSKQCNILQTHGYKGHCIAFVLSRLLKLPWIAFSHGWTDENLKMRLYNRIDRWLLSKASLCVTVSQAMCSDVTALRGADNPTVVIHNAVDPAELKGAKGGMEVRSGLGVGRGEILLGVIARLSPEKGHALFLEALATLNRSAVKAVIVGDGPLRKELEEYSATLGLKNKVHFTGYTEYIRDYYEAIDLLVSPSLKEGMPNVVLEAVALKIPVLAADVGGTREIIREGLNGWLIPPNDSRRLSEKLLELIDNPQALSNLRGSPSAALPRHFRPKERAQQILRLYKRVLV